MAGRHRGRRLCIPPGDTVRPTSDRAREALMSILEHGDPPLRGARFLDLFAGSGAIGLEALSRGAASALMVENGRDAATAIRRNIELLREEGSARLLESDATRLGRTAEPFDIAFLDPPYRGGLAETVLAGLVAGGWLAAGARVVVEVARSEGLSAPPPLEVEDERRYGAARMLFLRMAR